MTLYTKSGDGGYTLRPGGQRLRKNDLRVEMVGTIDELNSHIGLCQALALREKQPAVAAALESVQGELLCLGAMVAAAGTSARPELVLCETSIARMEKLIDEICAPLPELTHFILPAGCELACRLHIARTVCRRAERDTVGAADREPRIPAMVFTYLNRLSDLLFALARQANAAAGVADVVWKGQ